MKTQQYIDTLQRIEALIEGETDLIAVMSTISCELFHAFGDFNWVGFYRRVDDDTLKVGPYHGTHGCLTITLDRGVCGKCAREGVAQIENDVLSLAHHIACSVDTRSEIVLPVKDAGGRVQAVLDIDSTEPGSFDATDLEYLEKLVSRLGGLY